ncbi:MAG: hypothetical protein QM742_17690 [Aquabacterium sp.]
MLNIKSLTRAAMGLAAAASLVIMTGCAHPISMSPKAASDLSSQVPSKIDKNVAYVISAADLAKEVETPGGGGDKVKYSPYRDLDASLYQAFSAVFKDVTKVATPAEAKDVSFVITPTITTTSSSDSAFTWPPTQFSVELLCKVVDAKGQAVTEVRANGSGAATFDEFKSDFSLSARRASADAVNKLVKALANAPELRR